jgi:hypothetical protein
MCNEKKKWKKKVKKKIKIKKKMWKKRKKKGRLVVSVCILLSDWFFFNISVSCFSSTCRYNTVHVPCGISIQTSPVGLPLEGWGACLRDLKGPKMNLFNPKEETTNWYILKRSISNVATSEKVRKKNYGKKVKQKYGKKRMGKKYGEKSTTIKYGGKIQGKQLWEKVTWLPVMSLPVTWLTSLLLFFIRLHILNKYVIIM